MSLADDRPVTERPVLAELAERCGVATDYWDWQGHHRVISSGTVVAVLEAFGVAASSDEQAATSLRELDEAPWRRMLPTILIGRGGHPVDVVVHVPHGEPVLVDVVTEEGDVLPGEQRTHDVAPREIDGVLVGEACFRLPPDLPLGYHTVRAAGPSGEDTTPLVVAPDRLELPELPGQAWGLMTQLYSVRSRASWGLGDLADLATLASYGAQQGADFLLVNPLHAHGPVPPLEDSPYLPTSRRFLDPLYLRVEAITEYADLGKAAQEEIAAVAAGLAAGNTEAALLDRNAVWTAKLAALGAVYDVPRTPEREADLARFRAREGAILTQFATWCALAERFGEEWWVADEAEAGGAPALDPASPRVAELAEPLADRIDFYGWLQWVVEEQLAAAHDTALREGMRIGLITDLAVGVHPTGAEVWSLGRALATGVSVGAPPDPFNQLGQDWSQPPWRPRELAELGYAPYRAVLRTVLRHAGAVRIDHVMGLFRLWCVPQGAAPAHGTYVRLDHEAMVSILLLEAHRAGAFVIGEDLGVVEPFVRDYLADRGVLGTSILWFEIDGDRPRPPETWRELCLATVTTHDLPPTAGYLAGDHVLLRDRLGLLTRPVAEELAVAEHEREVWLGLLRERGLLAADADTAETVEALHVLLRRAPSRLLGVMVSDLVGERRTQNQPGTHREYPNWRIPLAGPDGRAVLLEDLPESPIARRFVARLRAAESH